MSFLTVTWSKSTQSTKIMLQIIGIATKNGQFVSEGIFLYKVIILITTLKLVFEY